MGLGYRKQPVKADIQDKTASRALNTIYQNTTGRPILCILTLDVERGAGASQATCWALVKETTPPTISFGAVYLKLLTDNIEQIGTQLIFPVPNEWYYKAEFTPVGTGTLTVDKWMEVEL